MFQQQTLFIIGAGASFEFGLPLGGDLVGRIRDACFREAESPQSFGSITTAFLQSGVVNANLNVRDRLNEFARGLSGKRSIDQYLRNHRHDDGAVMLGKICIADIILKQESVSSLSEDNAALGFIKANASWLGLLFDKATENVDAEHFFKAFDNTRFITFNYDRCLEVYLFRQLMLTGRLSGQAAAQVVQKIGITHVYGDVGHLDWAGAAYHPENIRLYGEQQQNIPANPAYGAFTNLLSDFPERVMQGARRIRTFGEGVEGAQVKQKLIDDIHWADRIVFLGFGFLEDNVDLLTSPIRGDRSPEVYATLFGMHPSIVATRENQLRAIAGLDPDTRVEAARETATNFLGFTLDAIARA